MDNKLIMAQSDLFAKCNIFVKCEGYVEETAEHTNVYFGRQCKLYRLTYNGEDLVSISSQDSDEDMHDEESYTILWTDKEVHNVRPLVATMWKYGGDRYYMEQNRNETREAFRKRVFDFADREWCVNGFFTLKEH